MPTDEKLEREIAALMVAQIATKRPKLAKALTRPARPFTPREIAELVRLVDEQENAAGCEFARAFPELARAAVADDQPEDDDDERAFLARMRRLDEQLVAEERELRGRRVGSR